MGTEQEDSLSDNELTAFIRQYPKHYDFAENTSIDSMFKLAEKYQDHGIYGKDIPLLLSDDGKAWVLDHFKRIRELRQSKEDVMDPH